MKNILLLTFAGIFILSVAEAQQNTFPILSTNIETQCVSNCIDQDSIPYISDSTSIEVVMTIQLFEVTDISTIHVKLGNTDGGSELLDKTYTFDVFGNVGNGCTYNRMDYTITLGLGHYNGLASYFSQVILERGDHSLTDAVVFNR